MCVRVTQAGVASRAKKRDEERVVRAKSERQVFHHLSITAFPFSLRFRYSLTHCLTLSFWNSRNHDPIIAITIIVIGSIIIITGRSHHFLLCLCLIILFCIVYNGRFCASSNPWSSIAFSPPHSYLTARPCSNHNITTNFKAYGAFKRTL